MRRGRLKGYAEECGPTGGPKGREVQPTLLGIPTLALTENSVKSLNGPRPARNHGKRTAGEQEYRRRQAKDAGA